MDLVTIYEDDNLKVEIDTFIEMLLILQRNCYFNIHKIVLEEVVDKALENFIKMGGNPKNKKVISTTQIPIFNKDNFITVSEPYNCFDDAIILFSIAIQNVQSPIPPNWKKLMEMLITIYYSTQMTEFCTLKFFDEKIDRVSGVLTFDRKDDIIILPFEFDED